MHAAEEEAPSVGLRDPAGQGVHIELEEPREAPYDPAGHRAQTDAPVTLANVPEAHMEHVDADVAPGDDEKLPSPHRMHCEAEIAPVMAR